MPTPPGQFKRLCETRSKSSLWLQIFLLLPPGFSSWLDLAFALQLPISRFPLSCLCFHCSSAFQRSWGWFLVADYLRDLRFGAALELAAADVLLRFDMVRTFVPICSSAS